LLFKNFRTLSLETKQILRILFISGLLFWSSLACMFPTLPLYLEDIGLEPFKLGIVIASFGIGVLLSRPFLGKLSDLHSRKLALLIGMSAMAIAPVGYLIPPTMPIMILVRIVHGISLAGFASAYLTFVADLVPVANRGEIMGYMSLQQPLGLSLGPIIGGGLLELTNQYAIPFIAASVLGMGAVLTACCLPKRSPLEPPAKSHRQFWRIFAKPYLRIPSIVMTLVGISVGGLQTYVSPYIRSMAVSLSPSCFFTVMAVFTFLIRCLAGSRSDHWGRGFFITYSLIFSLSAMILLYKAYNASMLIFAAILQGAGYGILVPMIAALMADRSPTRERGRSFSLCMMGFDLGLILGGPMLISAAAILASAEVETNLRLYRYLFFLAGGAIALSLLFFLAYGGGNFSQSIKFAIGRGQDIYSLNLHRQNHSLD
jgi:MFS family permease